MNKPLLQLYGLKFNPFSPEVPIEALQTSPPMESFFFKVEQTLLREGGFGLIAGNTGAGKSVALRLLANRLSSRGDVVVALLSRPQAGVIDFYREMGEIFGVALKPSNRWGGSKVIREAWQTHIEKTLLRPVLLVDEAQEMNPLILAELRLLASTRFDSRQILTVVLAGDPRLLGKLQREDLAPIASRIRTRLALDYVQSDDLRALLKHRLLAAGNSALMTPALMDTLAEHANGNCRALLTLAGELLATAAQKELPQLDEKLFFESFVPPAATRPTAAGHGRRP